MVYYRFIYIELEIVKYVVVIINDFKLFCTKITTKMITIL